MSKKENVNVVTLDSKTIKELYKHVTMLANSKYKVPIQTLKTRHVCYDIEDFVQDTMKLLLDSFKTKTFTTLAKLKNFANLTMEFHYLKEKRKYFYTKQRGSMTCVSLNDSAASITGVSGELKHGETYENFLSDDKDIDLDILELNNLKSKDLQVFISNGKYAIRELRSIESFTNNTVLSVNHFIEIQRHLGIKDTCKYYKSKGFYMTKDVFNDISQCIIDYIKKNGILEVAREKKTFSEKFMDNPIMTKTKDKYSLINDIKVFKN